MIQEMSRGQGEGPELRKDTQDYRDSIDSHQRPSFTRLDDVVNEGDMDEVSNYMVFAHDKHKEAKDKQTHIFSPLSPRPDDVSHYLNENPAPSLGHVGLPRTARTVIIIEPTEPEQNGFTITLTTTGLPTTNITITKLKKQLLDIMSNDPDSMKGQISLDLYNALSNSVQQDRRTARKDSYKEANLRKRIYDDQDPLANREGGEKSQEAEVCWGNGYELFGNHFMSKEEYEYNMDQVRFSMSDDMDWSSQSGLSDIKTGLIALDS
nr:hypothetical protein [Tanacetum cinerariifolium]